MFIKEVNDMNNKIVYRHRRLDTNEVFYVGIGALSRAKSKRGRSSWWNRIVQKSEYTIEIIAVNLTWGDACELEQLLISQYGRKDSGMGTLVNMTDGSNGTLGNKISDEHKEIIRYHGKNRTEAQRVAISERMKDRFISTETRNKISIANKGRVLSEEHKEKLRVASLGNNYSLGHKHSDETKKKMSSKRKGVPQSDYHNNRISESKKKLILDSATGFYYNGVKDVCDCLGYNYNNMASQLNGKLKNRTSLKHV